MNAVQKMIELMKAKGIPINNPLEPQDTGEPVMDEINQLFPIQPQSQTFTFVQDDGSIIELAVNTKPVDMMTPFEVIDEYQKNYINNRLVDSIGEGLCKYPIAEVQLENQTITDFNSAMVKRRAEMDKAQVVTRWDAIGYYVMAINYNKTNSGIWYYAIEGRMLPKTDGTGWFVKYNRIANYTPFISGDEVSRGYGQFDMKPSGKPNVAIGTHTSKCNHIVIASETPNGVRLLVKNTKTKAILWGQTIWMVKENRNVFQLGLQYVNTCIMGELFEMYNEKDVIKLAESYPKYYNDYQQAGNNIQLHNFTQRDMYYFNSATNLKDVFNKAYGKTGQDSLTKHAFGGAQSFKYFEQIQAAIILIRLFKPFPREFFDNINLDWVTPPDTEEELKQSDYNPALLSLNRKYKLSAMLNNSYEVIKFYDVFFKYFGVNNKMIKEVKDGLDNKRGPNHDWVKDAVIALRTIPAGNKRKAVVNEVKRQKLTAEEIHNYVVREARKYRGEIKKTSNTPVINSFNGKEIMPGVIFVAPKDTEDLHMWGNQQNNCIGTNYANRVATKGCFIFGFMDKETKEWIGHAMIKYFNSSNMIVSLREKEENGGMSIIQFLGKHNQPIDPQLDAPLTAWMNKNLSTKTNKKAGK